MALVQFDPNDSSIAIDIQILGEADPTNAALSLGPLPDPFFSIALSSQAHGLLETLDFSGGFNRDVVFWDETGYQALTDTPDEFDDIIGISPSDGI